MKEIWIRLGTVIKITDAEEQMIFGDEGAQMENTLRTVIAQGRFCPSGETYIPSEAVRSFNKTYGTAHDEEDWCCDLDSSQKFKVTITETLERMVEVEAVDQHEAEQIVSDRWHNSEYVLEADDFTDVSFKAVPMLDEHSRSLLEGS